jgi:hypothetical protein
MGIAASVAGRCNLRLLIAISSGSGGRNSVGLLVFILYFYFFIGQQFRAGVCHEKQDRKKLFCNCIDDGSRPAVHALQRE